MSLSATRFGALKSLAETTGEDSKAAARFSLVGDGEMEALLFDDGTPAGFVMRDPVRKQKVEVHCREGNVRVVFDGQTQRGWKLERIAKDENLDESLFGGRQ